ncbi:bifunctional DNA-formamidopyrimidine glycosylase/DNA-(apurinic or apyrimidinic site) lyase [Gryllotalpicola protaetiae]|uniref:Formamidopyrimidine-DNA glycosylase n=1 Tax=Gryllotalpicola protaetiae TaxID=2419771 RepID=A0A387BJ18_9MICO|nr:bifunctional DNA-formamidopyrimidine glycosylase/DNA-(apurinic or apyrimidinic site) lyase [Gryllotalpicola protaetiae]AYG02154.1 bifunctional DNA-formamidopyrimidine glycosylase/DNA-(apurinic or apyrimidinic site) lyase [Gryllotalpicola protaetiae]
MPELPEVEVVRLGLAPAVTGAVVTAVDVFDERAITRHDRARGSFADRLLGRRMLAPKRRGKFLWIPLDDGEALLAHLGMTGQLLLRESWARPQDEPHVRVRVELTHPSLHELAVFFRDQRTFGSLALDELTAADAGDLVPGQVAHIARDPLDPLCDDSAFLVALTRKSSAIKRVLLDQRAISGIGNIYADEALWAARIHPEQPANTLSRAKAKLLLAEIRLVLAKALTEGGTSFDSQYVNVNGQAGYFAHSLNAYGREGAPCPRCGTPIVRVSFMNRSSHFCPRDQRLR